MSLETGRVTTTTTTTTTLFLLALCRRQEKKKQRKRKVSFDTVVKFSSVDEYNKTSSQFSITNYAS